MYMEAQTTMFIASDLLHCYVCQSYITHTEIPSVWQNRRKMEPEKI